MGSTRISTIAILSLIAGLTLAIGPSTVNAAPDLSQRFCRDWRTCETSGYQFHDLLNHQSQNPSVEILLPRLNAVAGIMVDIWADTILEGGYDISGLPSLDRVEGVYQQGRLVGYRITYSARAWRLGPNGERQEEGRIVESAFVTAALDGFFRDEGAVAEFFRN